MSNKVKITPISLEDFEPERLRLSNFDSVKNTAKGCQDAKISYIYKKPNGDEVEGPLEIIFENLESNYSLSLNQQGTGLNLKVTINEDNKHIFGDTDNELFDIDGFYKKLKLTLWDLLIKDKFVFEKKVLDERKCKGKNALTIYAEEPNKISCGIYIPIEEDKTKTKYYDIFRNTTDKDGNPIPNIPVSEKATYEEKLNAYFTGRKIFTDFGFAIVKPNGEAGSKPIPDVKTLVGKNFKNFTIRVCIAGVRFYGKKDLKLKENVRAVLVREMEAASSSSGGIMDSCLGNISKAELEAMKAKMKEMERILNLSSTAVEPPSEEGANGEGFGDEQEFNTSSLFNNTM